MHVKALSCVHIQKAGARAFVMPTVLHTGRHLMAKLTASQNRKANCPPSASPLMKSSSYLKGRVLYWPSKESIYLHHWCTSYIKSSDGNLSPTLSLFTHAKRIKELLGLYFVTSSSSSGAANVEERHCWNARTTVRRHIFNNKRLLDCTFINSASKSSLGCMLDRDLKARTQAGTRVSVLNERQKHFAVYFQQSFK